MSESKQYNVGYIPGVFDLFHIGHLNLIQNAKKMCNYLIVGVLTDDLVVRFKKNPPIIPEEERKILIEALKEVDRVDYVTCENIEKMDAWNMYHFDCLFSGDDWKDHPAWIRDKQLLNEVGSDIYFFGYTQSTSSTRIKGILNERDKAKKILIYGAGVYGKRALTYYGEKNVIGFIDKDEAKIGTLIEGKPVLDIQKIKDQLTEGYMISIALKNGKEEVERQLKEITKAETTFFI